ncbi:MAG: tetratricopeptide repeat protein, partial [Chloroflexota bacterium]
DAYRLARDRYEGEAALILERLDTLPASEVDGWPSSSVRRSRAPRWLAAGTALLVIAAIAAFLLTALHGRSGTQTITGNAGQAATTPAPSPIIEAALARTQAHPRSAAAAIALGNAYLNTGNTPSADTSYRRAMVLAPGDPDPAALHAMILGTENQPARALALLRRTERSHPTYAKAWLLDGLFSNRGSSGYRHAIVAWKRFLALAPHNRLAPRVRSWIASARIAERRSRSRGRR